MSLKPLFFAATFIAGGLSLLAQVPITPSMNVPNTGQVITPLAARGSRFVYLNPGLANYPNDLVEFAVSAAVSPDHKTLALITSGDYGIYKTTGTQDTAASTEWIFIFDITNPLPVQKQTIQVPNTYSGIVFDPSGTAFYVGGGRNDNLHLYTVNAGVWSEAAGSPIALGHTSQAGGTPPTAAGVAISSDGTLIVVANYENDSVSVLQKSAGTWSKVGELDLRPGIVNPAESGVPGGEYPFWVSIAHNNTAFVSSIRDREIDVVNIGTPSAPTLQQRIALKGQPLKSTLDATQSTLYVAEEQADALAAIDTTTFALKAEVNIAAPPGFLPASVSGLSGNNTNSVTLSPDGATLYVTNGGANDVAVVSVAVLMSGNNPVLGLIPTGQYPNQAVLSANGQFMYVVNGKSPAGPNMGHCHGTDAASPETSAQCNAANQYSLQLTKAGLLFLPVPAAPQLAALSNEVAANNNYAFAESPSTQATMNYLAGHIQHVIYVIRENRTYDQMLGDLGRGNGDPTLTEFGASVTPNFHSIATNFVTLDNFYTSAEVSFDGWSWSTSGIAPDVVIRETPVNYSFRAGVSYDSEGDNRGINMVARTGTNAGNPNVLPGLTDFAAPDGPNNQINGGYLWSAALRAGLTVRDYGAFGDSIGSAVAFPDNLNAVQIHPSNPDLNSRTDLYFRSYDLNNADYFLFEEWQRDFTANYASGGLPNLEVVRLPHDHTGSYGTALNGVNTPELQVADNDYATALIVQTIANSPVYQQNTLVLVVEDDAQNGGDHVDAHRSPAYIVGPYVRHGAVVSTQYNTVNFVRTIERLLGLSANHLTDALAEPMADVFDVTMDPTHWSFTAAPAPILYNTTLPLPVPSTGLVIPKPTHNGKYWARVTKGFDFSKADAVDGVAYNRVLWRGLKGDVVYPGDSSLAETRKRYKLALRGPDGDDDDEKVIR